MHGVYIFRPIGAVGGGVLDAPARRLLAPGRPLPRTAAILLCAALSCMVAMAAAPAIAMVLMGLALAGRGWWCRRNAKDAWDLSVWSM